MPPLLPHSIQGFFFLQEVLHWSPHYSTYSPIIQSATFDKERITVSVEIPNEVHLPNPAIVYLRGTLAFSSAGDIEIKVPDKASAVVYDTALSALTKQPPNFSLIGLGKSIRFHSPKDYALDLLVQGPWDSGKTIVVRSRYNHVLMRTAQDNSLFKVEGCFAFIELRNGTIHLDAQIVLPLDNGSLFTFGSSTAFVFAPHHPIEQPTEVSQRRDHHTTAPPLRSRVGPTISSRKAGVSRLGKVSDERPHKMGLAGSQMIVKTASQIVAPASSTPKELYPDVTSLFSAPPNQSGVQSLPHPPLTLDKITHTADLNDRSHIRMNQALPIGGNPNTEISPTTFEIPPFPHEQQGPTANSNSKGYLHILDSPILSPTMRSYSRPHSIVGLAQPLIPLLESNQPVAHIVSGTQPQSLLEPSSSWDALLQSDFQTKPHRSSVDPTCEVHPKTLRSTSPSLEMPGQDHSHFGAVASCRSTNSLKSSVPAHGL